MQPASPVIKGYDEVVYAKDQPEYLPLPAIRQSDGCIVTRWQMSLRTPISGSDSIKRKSNSVKQKRDG